MADTDNAWTIYYLLSVTLKLLVFGQQTSTLRYVQRQRGLNKMLSYRRETALQGAL